MNLDDNWREIRTTLDSAVSIAWDTCHKIYILMDEPEHQQMESYGYDPLLRLDEIGGPDYAYSLLREWFEESCGLRFVSAVKTVPGNPNDGFTSLISQFEDEDDLEETW